MTIQAAMALGETTNAVLAQLHTIQSLSQQLAQLSDRVSAISRSRCQPSPLQPVLSHFRPAPIDIPPSMPSQAQSDGDAGTKRPRSEASHPPADVNPYVHQWIACPENHGHTGQEEARIGRVMLEHPEGATMTPPVLSLHKEWPRSLPPIEIDVTSEHPIHSNQIVTMRYKVWDVTRAFYASIFNGHPSSVQIAQSSGPQGVAEMMALAVIKEAPDVVHIETERTSQELLFDLLQQRARIDPEFYSALLNTGTDPIVYTDTRDAILGCLRGWTPELSGVVPKVGPDGVARVYGENRVGKLMEALRSSIHKTLCMHTKTAMLKLALSATATKQELVAAIKRAVPHTASLNETNMDALVAGVRRMMQSIADEEE